jgi:uroporphyrinogen decarboxylase
VTLQPIDRFGLDAAILFSDILTVFDAMGVTVEFSPAPTVAEPVRTVADVQRLQFSPAAEHLGYVFDAVRACKEALADRVPLIGFCGAPMTTASYLIEGGSSKEFLHTKSLAFNEPEVFSGLMESITTLLIDYLGEQVKAGADALQIFESWGAAFAPDDYRHHILPHVQRLVTEVKKYGVPVILFLRGNASLLEQARETSADVLGVDWGIELGRAIEVVGKDRVVQGNLDPITLFAPDDVLVAKAKGVVEAGRAAKAHVFNLGHGISRHTNPDKVRLLVDTVHSA